MAKNNTEVVVAKLPECDICKHVHGKAQPNIAAYDAKTTTGQWANVCEDDKSWIMFPELGLGKGQRLALA